MDQSLPFTYNFPPLMVALLGIALLATLWLIIVYLRRLQRVRKHFAPKGTDAPQTNTEQCPPASIIVSTQDQSLWLEDLLPDLLSQQYAPGYEIIVVNEGASEDTRALVEGLAVNHPNLYLTYTPDGARNLSRKKLALTIGIKAARYPVVVHTSAASRINSPHWLEGIMAPFANAQTEVVLGYAAPDSGDRKIGHRRRAYDYAADAVTWLSGALAGRPYRGTEYNLAYTRQAFFNNKGFSRSLNLVSGDDDIFIHEIARRHNTQVVLSPETTVTAVLGDHGRALRALRQSHAFTGARLPKGSRRLMASGPLALWLALGCAIAAVALYPLNIIAAGTAAIVVLTTLIMLMSVWRKTLVAMQLKPLRLSVPGLTLLRPFRQMLLHMPGRNRHNYTWK